MASGPVGFTIVRVGAIAMRAGAILRPWLNKQMTLAGGTGLLQTCSQVLAMTSIGRLLASLAPAGEQCADNLP